MARTGSLVKPVISISDLDTRHCTHINHEAVHKFLILPVITTISNHMSKKRKCKAVVSV